MVAENTKQTKMTGPKISYVNYSIEYSRYIVYYSSFNYKAQSYFTQYTQLEYILTFLIAFNIYMTPLYLKIFSVNHTI